MEYGVSYLVSLSVDGSVILEETRLSEVKGILNRRVCT